MKDHKQDETKTKCQFLQTSRRKFYFIHVGCFNVTYSASVSRHVNLHDGSWPALPARVCVSCAGWVACLCVCVCLLSVWLQFWQPPVLRHAYENMQEWAWNQGQNWGKKNNVGTLARPDFLLSLATRGGTRPPRLQAGVTNQALLRKPHWRNPGIFFIFFFPTLYLFISERLHGLLALTRGLLQPPTVITLLSGTELVLIQERKVGKKR